MKFEGNNMFSYNEVTEILKDNYFDREAVQIALMEKAMDGKDYEPLKEALEKVAKKAFCIGSFAAGKFN